MMRVLKPGGTAVLMEMVCDGQTDAQMTHMRFHHWSAEIDTTMGISHRETMPRTELLDLVAGLHLADAMVCFIEPDGDPMDTERIAIIESRIDAILERGSGSVSDDQLCSDADAMRDQLHHHGFLPATEALIVGRKPS
jgi:hypothetical protein